MNIGKLTAIVALTAGLGATAPALAAVEDETGLGSLGIDISAVGGSLESVQQFLSGLAPDTQRSVLTGCQTAIANPITYAPNVIAFCNTAVGVPAAGFTMGFAPVEPQFVPAPTLFEPGPAVGPESDGFAPSGDTF